LLGGRMFFGHAAPPDRPAPHGCAWICGNRGAELLDYRMFLSDDMDDETLIQVPRQGWIRAGDLRVSIP
jgi:hypothetical protein